MSGISILKTEARESFLPLLPRGPGEKALAVAQEGLPPGVESAASRTVQRERVRLVSPQSAPLGHSGPRGLGQQHQ